jgi:CRISPR system Cascade subunit CasA
MHNLLTDPLIRIRLPDGGRMRASLPEVLALLSRDSIAEFIALRRHQRHAWHALMVQLGAIALHAAGRDAIPEEAEDWRSLLRALTPGFADDAPWHLVGEPAEPAFLQAPVPGGDLSGFKALHSPDAIDVLVTAKNHDLKVSRAVDAEPDDWLYALTSLQTMQGVMGAGNYGVSRMNGGYGSRPCVALRVGETPGRCFRRDLRVLTRRRDAVLERVPFLKAEGGLALVYLRPWNGEDQVAPDELDPYYIEICRRIRLVESGGIQGLTRGSKAARIAAKDLKGNTGDPWAPVAIAEGKVLSITASGFDYRLMQRLLFEGTYQPSILGEVQADDPEDGLVIFAAALARGQGKTEGYHERIVPITRRVRRLLAAREIDVLARIGSERVAQAGVLERNVLRPALFRLAQDGRKEIDYQDTNTERIAARWVAELDRLVDQTFFPDLWAEAEAPEAERPTVRRLWLSGLARAAVALLDEAAGAISMATVQRYRARTRARATFYGALHARFPDLRQEGAHHDAA